jgi:hypothetical protein
MLALTPGMDADTGPSAQLVVVVLLTASGGQSAHDLRHITSLNKTTSNCLEKYTNIAFPTRVSQYF